MTMRKKRYLFLILGLILVLISGCTPKNSTVKKEGDNQKTQEELKRTKEEEKEKLMVKFKELILEKEEPSKVIKFIDQNITKVEKEQAEDMIKEFEKLQEDYIEIYTDELNKENRQQLLITQLGLESQIDSKKMEKIKDKKLKQIVSKILASQYKLVNKKGLYCPVINYEDFKKYEKFLSDEMKEYFNIRIIEVNFPAIVDGQIVINWGKLGDRLITIEKYLKKYPEGEKCEELARLYGEYLIVYMSGSDKTPIYNVEDKKISENIIDEYKKLITNNKKTITRDIIDKYLKIIEKNDYLINDVVTSRIVELYNESISRLEDYK